MLEKIGSYDAKTKLPEILRRVESGESFTSTSQGKSIADLIPSRSNERLKAETAIKNILKVKKRKMSDAMLKELKDKDHPC